MTQEQDKERIKELRESLEKSYEIAWEKLSGDEEKDLEIVADGYRAYLDAGKTERLCAANTVSLAKKAGFQSLEKFQKAGKIVPGDKIYVDYRGKAVLLFIIGEEPLAKGMNIIGAHIDAPRLDMKPAPLYEKESMAFFKTHYYGGIKKYQWVTMPLALHGVVVKTDDTVVDISIGEGEDEPVFCITDLLPHLAQEQMVKKMTEGITGEGLNLIVGSIPYKGEDIKEAVKLNILAILQEKYGITEADFASAELEAVPAGAAREVGFDRSFVGAYGQDDRICAFAAAKSVVGYQGVPKQTICALLADKEEIGSYGNTGMQSNFFENEVAELIALQPENKGELDLRRCLKHSNLLSADVTAGLDPNFSGTHDPFNAPMMGKGLVVSKYGGSRGKSGSNDAHAEFLARLRSCFDAAGVTWQMGELGRVDLGGGGTIAHMLAKYGMDVVDCGPALLSMHSPFELASKVDLYQTVKGYRAFLDL